MRKQPTFHALPPPATPRPRPPANDQTPITASVAAFARAVTDPRLDAHLGARLGPLHIPRVDKEDLAAAVKEGLWRRREDADPACELPRILALANRVLDARLVDYWRRRTARRAVFARALYAGEDHAPEHGDAHEDAPGTLDRPPWTAASTPERDLLAKEKLGFVVAMAPELGMTDDDLDVMEVSHAGDASWEELAAERGVGADALRKRIARLREKLNAAWEALQVNDEGAPRQKRTGRCDFLSGFGGSCDPFSRG